MEGGVRSNHGGNDCTREMEGGCATLTKRIEIQTRNYRKSKEEGLEGMF